MLLSVIAPREIAPSSPRTHYGSRFIFFILAGATTGSLAPSIQFPRLRIPRRYLVGGTSSLSESSNINTRTTALHFYV